MALAEACRIQLILHVAGFSQVWRPSKHDMHPQPRIHSSFACQADPPAALLAPAFVETAHRMQAGLRARLPSHAATVFAMHASTTSDIHLACTHIAT